MTEQLIKSKKRVQQHGEVFTPRWMVDFMLDIPEVAVACQSIDATFLEPAAGDGNFLLAILERKLTFLTSHYPPSDWARESLWVLASIYGIEFLADNLELARHRLFVYYLDWYEKSLGERLDSKSDLYKSAWFLIRKNIIRGNTLTKKHPDLDLPLAFYEWQRLGKKGSRLRAKPFRLADWVGEDLAESQFLAEGQLSLFDWEEEVDDRQEQVRECRLTKVYQLED